jgi:Flp pilus assembly protein TadG
MLKSLGKLFRDRRGNALVIAGAAMPLVIGSAGLATDTVEWALWKRQLQRAADSAAMAGVYAIVDGKTASTGATNDLLTNDHTGITRASTTVTTPNVTGFTNAVTVALQLQQALPFSSLFMSSPPTINATATAAVSREGSYCVIALNNTTSPSILINGNITVTLGCGMISNSTSTTQSISVSGNAHTVNATPIAGVGKVPAINGTNTELSYQLKQADPYAGKYPTGDPSTMTCNKLATQITLANQTVTSGGNTYQVINPGCYQQQGGGGSAANSAFSTSNQNIAMNPGVYYIDSADFNIGSNTNIIVNSSDTAQGVTIILTGSSPGSVQIAANADVKLRAQSTDATYANMLFIQKAGATAASLISGNTTSSFDGTFYFPSTQVNLNGDGSAKFKCAMLVANIVSFSGDSQVQNNTTGCHDTTQQAVERVRLIS